MRRNRECGGCTVCCTALPIETRELRKLPGVTCEHCEPGGCAIYETRFPICRTYHCGWQMLDMLDEDWRPDLSGVLVTPKEDDGIEFLLLGGEAAVRRAGFAEFVQSCIVAGTPTWLAVPGPAGHYAARVRIDQRLEGQDADAIRSALSSALAASTAHVFQRMDGEDAKG